MKVDHPAKYNDKFLPIFADMVNGAQKILDPFAGSGKIFELRNHLAYGPEIVAIEIEPEFASLHPETVTGDALNIKYPDEYFDAIVVSPGYGNRMADQYLGGAQDDSGDRNTYAFCLGRRLHEHNGGGIQWGQKYREFHERAWKESIRVLRRGGKFVLNVKDHIRAGELQLVTMWHILCLESLGLLMIKHVQVPVSGNRKGRNGEKRVDHESIICFIKK